MQETDLALECIVDAPRQRVFESWTSKDDLAKWHCGMVDESIMDLAEGGTFLVRFAPNDEGRAACVQGKYLQVEAPHHLRYTWSWDDNEHESIVDIVFDEQGEKTVMKVTHEQLSSKSSADNHREGWMACLSGLQQFLATETPANS